MPRPAPAPAPEPETLADPAADRGRRRGFTLIELLVVLTIIGLLLALLIPAIGAAVKAARAAAVQAELSSLSQALAQFRTEKGDLPPSRIVLNEAGFFDITSTTTPITGSNHADADVTVGQLCQRSVTAFRKFWPRMQVATSSGFTPTIPTPTASFGGWYDFNGDGNNNGVNGAYIIEGQECLAFFLGGVCNPDPNSAAPAWGYLGMAGWSNNPGNPFMSNYSSSGMYNPNRTAPYFEFAAGRLQARVTFAGDTGLPSSQVPPPGYVDSLNSQGTTPPQNFYAYFSTNNGAGYDPNDINLVETDTQGNSPIGLNFWANQPVHAPGGGQQNRTLSPSPNPYTSGATYSGATNPNTVVTYYQPQSFQLFSAGADGLYGVGGIYTPTATATTLPRQDMGGGAPYPFSPSADGALRTLEQDNLTNFHNGKLQ